jgi:hypothetical protein
MSPVSRVCMEFEVVVEGNGGTNDKSIWEGQISARVVDVTEVLLSLTTVKNVMVSMNEDSYHWTETGDSGRRICSWTGHICSTRNIGLVQVLYCEGQVPE